MTTISPSASRICSRNRIGNDIISRLWAAIQTLAFMTICTPHVAFPPAPRSVHFSLSTSLSFCKLTHRAIDRIDWLMDWLMVRWLDVWCRWYGVLQHRRPTRSSEFYDFTAGDLISKSATWGRAVPMRLWGTLCFLFLAPSRSQFLYIYTHIYHPRIGFEWK